MTVVQKQRDSLSFEIVYTSSEQPRQLCFAISIMQGKSKICLQAVKIKTNICVFAIEVKSDVTVTNMFYLGC